MNPADFAKQVACNDINPGFIEDASKFAAWEYYRLYEALEADPTLTPEAKFERFSRSRGDAMTRAMVLAARKHRVPYELKRLSCNGQSKLFVKMGRVVVIQEPLQTLYGHHPQAAAYKRDLSRSIGILNQLELDLGDKPGRLLDWSAGLLGVVLHGASGIQFRKRDCELGALMLGLPDAGYENWILRLDLHDIALFGSSLNTTAESLGSEQQEDRVIVKRKNNKRAIISNG